MKNRKNAKWFLGIILICGLGFAAPASAHLPRLERGNVEIKVEKPEISKAYYGWLEGKPAVYSIDSKKPFLLYAGLLSPRVENGRMDYSATIYKDGELFAQVPADDSFWLINYEPFGNDYYAEGPEYEQEVLAGKYEIEVFNSGNRGNYVLAIGKTENLSAGEFMRTLFVLPSVKEEFFGKPWWEAYNNLVGLFTLIILAVVSTALYFIVSFIRNKRLKSKLDEQYRKLPAR